MSMYNQFAARIKAGADIAKVAKQIAMYHLRNVLTDAEVESLHALLDQYANPESNRPEVQVSIAALVQRLEACERHITALQEALTALGGAEAVPPAAGEPDAYPQWRPWDGVSRDYCYGAIVQHNGELWISEYAHQNTWEPGVMGTERLWVRYQVPEVMPGMAEGGEHNDGA